MPFDLNEPQYRELELPILDPRNETEVVEQALNSMVIKSGGLLNDISPASTSRVLIEALSFCAAEMLYHVNKLPLAMSLTWLALSGVKQRLGTKAKVEITFTLTSVQNTNITIPKGFELKNSNGDLIYITDQNLLIPPGVLQGNVVATAVEIGSIYNVSAYSITEFTQPLPYLAGVLNTEPALGGSDEELIEETIERGVEALRLRGLSTLPDYEEAAQSVLGQKSVAKAIKLLALDKKAYQLGAVHLFLLNDNGQPANAAQVLQVKNELSDRIFAASSFHVSPMHTLEVDCELVAKLQPLQDPEEVADAIWNSFISYFTPSADKVGKTLIKSEVEFALRAVEGLEYLDPVILNGKPQNVPMPFIYSIPIGRSLFITLIDVNKISYEYFYGEGDPE